MDSRGQQRHTPDVLGTVTLNGVAFPFVEQECGCTMGDLVTDLYRLQDAHGTITIPAVWDEHGCMRVSGEIAFRGEDPEPAKFFRFARTRQRDARRRLCSWWRIDHGAQSLLRRKVAQCMHTMSLAHHSAPPGGLCHLVRTRDRDSHRQCTHAQELALNKKQHAFDKRDKFVIKTSRCSHLLFFSVE
jgi:hypothetical protein